MEILAEGRGDYFRVDPDGFRDYVREHKQRALVPRLLSEQEAVARFVQDGDYLVFDCNYLQRGPAALIREVVRQRKRDLWIGGKFSYVAAAVLVAGGCASRLDIGFVSGGPWLTKAWSSGQLKTYEYSNAVMTLRLQAGAMGVPFLPVRSLGGTDGFRHSGAKLVRDPFTGQPVVLVPALNPDVALIHVQQADVYGNARVFGTGIAHVECALASRKVIISAEEIIDSEEFRRNPGLTTIPYYVVDAVVHLPFGAYPGTTQGYYASDTDHVIEIFGAMNGDRMDEYLDKWVYSVASHEETLAKRVGVARLLEMMRRETIKEGYRP